MTTSRRRCLRPVPLLALAALAGAATHEVDSVPALFAALAAAQPHDEVVLKKGTYRIEHPLQIRVDGLVLRGATGEAKDVEIVGGGMDPCDSHLQDAIDVATDDVVIADLTVRDFSYNGIHLRGENDADRLTVRNVTTRDIGEVHIKGSRPTAPETVDGVLIDHCRLIQDKPRLFRAETDSGSDYIGGIDIMAAKDIVIRDSVFTGIHGSKDEGKPAIFLWQGAINPTIERNRISGCARGIGIGNPAPPASGPYHGTGGVVRDNVIERGPWGGGNTIAIELCSVKDLQVLHNTVYSVDAGYFRTVSIYDSDGAGPVAGLLLANNLIRGQIKDFTGGTGWKQQGDLVDGVGSTITAAWFVDPTHGDYHLTEAAGAALGAGEKLADAPTDIDGDPRPAKADLGADQRVAAAKRDGAPHPAGTTAAAR
jgi:hypothetical protein